MQVDRCRKRNYQLKASQDTGKSGCISFSNGFFHKAEYVIPSHGSVIHKGVHSVLNFLLTGSANTAGLSMNGSMAEPGLADDVIVAPFVEHVHHIHRGIVDDGESEITYNQIQCFSGLRLVNVADIAVEGDHAEFPYGGTAAAETVKVFFCAQLHSGIPLGYLSEPFVLSAQLYGFFSS